MQFDKTRIAVRERSYPELLDLALKVVAAHPLQLAVCAVIGAGPMILLNVWLFGDFIADELVDVPDPSDSLFGFFTMLSLAIVLEMSLAAAPITLYLGRALFEENPKTWPLVKDAFRLLPQLVLFQVIVRGALTLGCVTWFVLFSVWPYLNEVILLERNPLFRRGTQGLSTLGRSTNLHSSNIGVLLGRWIVSTLLGTAWAVLLWLAIWWMRATLTGDWEFDWAVYAVWLQLAIWLVISYFAVVRFLSYLDFRIKGEGWEVELRMRAEAARLARQTAT